MVGMHRLDPPPPYNGGSLKSDAVSSEISLITPPVSPSIRDARTATAKFAFFARLRSFWVPDILWCLVGLGCGIAIVAVLGQYDGHRPPEWPLGITLNTFLAFLATIAKAAFLIPVTRGLGQLRWVWFTSRPRRVADFELFDGASRGAFGSLRLLLSRKGG